MFTETQMEPKGTRPGLTAMKLKNKIFLGLLALGSVAFFANCRHHSIEDRSKWVTGKISDKLDLDKNQEAQLDKIRDEVVAKVKAQKPQRDQLAQEFQTLVKADKLDKTKLKDLQTKHDALHAEIENLVIDRMAELHASLKPEQREKAANAIQKLRDHMAR